MKTRSTAHCWTKCIACLLCLIPVGHLLGATGRLDTLENGMGLILMENHSTPMIASVIFVRSGSKYESEYENGITH